MSSYKLSNGIEIDLGSEEAYDARTQNVWSFKQAKDIVHGIQLNISNMCGGYGFEFAGRQWADSERLYLCGEFSDGNNPQHLRIQKTLCEAKSGYAAKRFYKPKYKNLVRADFVEFRLQWMLFVVWQKCKRNADFRRLLLSIPSDAILVEDTTTDNGGSADIWGCRNKELRQARKIQEAELIPTLDNLPKKERERKLNIAWNSLSNIGTWIGQNNIGKILMACRDCLICSTEPVINLDLLRRKHIHLFGREIEI